MKKLVVYNKVFILLFGLVFLAASCNLLSDPFSFQSGERGVFKSEDGGDAFRPSNKLAKKGDIGNLSVNSLVFSPAHPEIIYLGASQGFYGSNDAAAHWTQFVAGFAVTGIAVDPFDSKLIYASGIVGSSGKIIKTVDGGISWTDIFSEPSKSNPATSIAVSRANPRILVAGLASGDVIKSIDAGSTWQSTESLSDRILKIEFGRNNNAYALTSRKGLFVSTDQGGHWSWLSERLTTQNFFSSQTALPTVSQFLDFALDPRQNGVVYLGTEQGLFRSVNSGQAWNLMTLPVKNMSLKVSAVSVSPTNSNVLYVGIGTTVFKSVNGGVAWETRPVPTGQQIRLILVDFNQSNNIYLGLGDKK